ncbi:IclR family transcriptional regulator [Pseudooceanicola nanhaiensis]|jgi:IclR family acetate operon transcriptional repressor|nr:IclR family transcriptional regulator [Pseudooceanicola nanhaiensis]
MSREKHTSAKSGSTPDGRRTPPRSIKRLMNLFEHIAESEQGAMTLAELSVSLGAPKSSLLTMLRPLADQDYLIHENGLYSLGPRVFQFATSILARSRFPQMVRHHLKLLRDLTGETSVFTTLDRDRRVVVYEDVVESNLSIRYVVPIGATRPVFATASGKVLLAYADAEWRERYLAEEPLRQFNPRTVTDPGKIHAALEEVRRGGVCFTAGEAMAEAAGIAAPIYDGQSHVIGALLIGVPLDRGIANRASYQDMVMDVARRLSIAAGQRN